MYEKIINISKNLKTKFFFDFEVYKSTWFQAGGKVDIFCIVENENELEIILNNIDHNPYFVLGAGSNLLVRDGGYKGIIIKLGKNFNKITKKENKIIAGAGTLDVNLSKFAYENSIKNLEFFCGIPGTIGGAIKMNAGCFNSETKDFLDCVSLIDHNGNKKLIQNNQINFSYRQSNLGNGIVTSAVFNAEYGDKNDIKKKIDKIKNFRKETQPIKNKTGGSTFKNPDGQHAAKLIEESGCKGLKIGNVIVSNKHSNFLINTGNASATQIEDLGKKIIEKVYNKFEIHLDWEIIIIGENIK